MNLKSKSISYAKVNKVMGKPKFGKYNTFSEYLKDWIEGMQLKSKMPLSVKPKDLSFFPASHQYSIYHPLYPELFYTLGYGIAIKGFTWGWYVPIDRKRYGLLTK